MNMAGSHFPLVAQLGHGAISDLRPLSGQERTLTNRRAPHAYVWVDVKSL